MKKLILSLVLGLFCTTAQAHELSITEVLESAPAVKTGIAFSVVENDFNFLAVVPIYTFQKFTVNTGYAGNESNTGHKAVLLVDYELLNMHDVDTGNTLLNTVVNSVDIRPGVWVGAGRIERDEPETDAGVSVTVFQARF